MFFTRIELNPQRRETKKLLANPRAMHGAVEACFPPSARSQTTGRNLWRVDADRHEVRLYIVSPSVPETEHLTENAGWRSAPAETAEFDRFLTAITKGQQFDFRVTVNPVKRQFVHGGRGRILPHVTEEQQLAWFTQRSEQWGFKPRDHAVASPDGNTEKSLPALRVIGRGDRQFGKHGDSQYHTVTQRQVTVVGRLEVTDTALLRASLTAGMGRGKAYGCGLMTLARVR